MNRSSTKLSDKAGLPPGTPVLIGSKKTNNVLVKVIDYDQTNFSEKVYEKVEDVFGYKQSDSISWVNVDGLHELDIIKTISDNYGLHPLSLEDILNTRSRPKFEEFDNYLFVTLKMLSIDSEQGTLEKEQISFALGKTWVLSFQEKEGDIFDGIRARLRESNIRLRQRSSDYLLYRLVDTVVDHYFSVTEYISEEADRVEEKVLNNFNAEVLSEIQSLKKMLIELRRSVVPLREAILSLLRNSTNLIEESTVRFLRDVYEHIVQVNDFVDSQRENLSDLMDLYLSGMSNRTNQVMQVLTIIATIFIPLTFLVGVYGMNFKVMPELNWQYGYLIIWVVMVLIVLVLINFFRRKKWL